MAENKMKLGKGTAIALGITVALAAITLVVAYLIGTTSELHIRNATNSEIRLEQVRHGGTLAGEGQGLVLPANDSRAFIAFRGRAKIEELEVKVMVGREQKTLRCSLDNSNRPCEFVVSILASELRCGACERPMGLILPPIFPR